MTSVDWIEQMFDAGEVALHTVPDLSRSHVPRDRSGEIERLRAKMQRLQHQPVPGREIATHPALRGLVQLRAGSAYGVDASTLALLMLAGPSAAGEWATVIGVPDFGAEAAAELGVRLEHTILVPEPGDSWLEAVAALADVTGLVVVRPPARVPERVVEKIGARLRTRGAALVALGAPGTWPRTEAHLSVVEPRWAGVGRGDGFLSERELVVEVRRGAGVRAARRETLWLGDAPRRTHDAHEFGDLRWSSSEGVETTYDDSVEAQVG